MSGIALGDIVQITATVEAVTDGGAPIVCFLGGKRKFLLHVDEESHVKVMQKAVHPVLIPGPVKVGDTVQLVEGARVIDVADLSVQVAFGAGHRTLWISKESVTIVARPEPEPAKTCRSCRWWWPHNYYPCRLLNERYGHDHPVCEHYEHYEPKEVTDAQK